VDILTRENLWGYKKRLEFVHEQLQRRFGARPAASIHILDVGCGNGSMLTIPLARLGYTMIGLDPHEPSIRKARTLAGTLPVSFFCTTLASFDPARRFDCVLCAEVLEHLDAPEACLRDATARLAPGGLLILSVPNGYGPFEIDSFIYYGLRLDRFLAKLRRWLGRQPPQEEIAGTENISCRHRQFFTGARLRRLFAACGLRIVARGTASLFCGPFSAHTLGHWPRLFAWNARVSDFLPACLQSAWYFALEKIPSHGV